MRIYKEFPDPGQTLRCLSLSLSLRLRDSEAKKIGGGLGHDDGELVKANDTVAIGVGLAHHLRELAVRQRVTHFGHGSGELGGGDVAVSVAVEGPENLQELLLVDEHLLAHVGHDGADELVELHGAVAVGVHVGQQDVKLVAGGLEAKGAEKGRQLQLREAAVRIHVEAHEDVLQLLQLLGLERGHHHENGRSKKKEDGSTFLWVWLVLGLFRTWGLCFSFVLTTLE